MHVSPYCSDILTCKNYSSLTSTGDSTYNTPQCHNQSVFIPDYACCLPFYDMLHAYEVLYTKLRTLFGAL
ncbi:hypothetical protein APHMUC_0479 [Anaplasma phagocytophilum str. ApMUC09]|uniref:Uncharacterized protein n=1 Tax=Anaplasma phagocytophilum str. ApMUC09 TaxID=1359152 RepID=A0A0F3NAF3_ANAPH|nr:hypothetical protein APHMUC_0479 [Anaplasma phagocytophilum str. ApMUC09]